MPSATAVKVCPLAPNRNPVIGAQKADAGQDSAPSRQSSAKRDEPDKPDDASRNQIVQCHRATQFFMNADGDPAHVRQMFENQAFSLIGRRNLCVKGRVHDFINMAALDLV